jgi:hypothetical protein
VAKKGWGWGLAPTSSSVKLTESDKQRIAAQFDGILQDLNAHSAQEENAENDAKGMNYPVLFFSKWHTSFLYLTTKYRCPSSHAIAPHFEMGFARMQMTTGDRVNLAYMRHTGKWEALYEKISIEDAIAAIREDPWFDTV